MRPSWIALPLIAAFGWRWRRRGVANEPLATVLEGGGVLAILAGAALVEGAIEEREPHAARMSALVFGSAGVALMALARAAARRPGSGDRR